MINEIYVFTTDENKDFKYNIEEDTIIYHFSINSSSTVEINLDKEDVRLDYYYNTINMDNNIFNIRVNHNKSNTHSEVYNHGVNLYNNKLTFNVDGVVPKESSKCICNQDNQILNMQDGKSTIAPNLLIDNYDVDSNHAAYIGRFRDEAIFYMMSRGISRDMANRILLNGFLINPIDVDQDKIKEFVEKLENI